MKIYTKTGDGGETSLFAGGRVPKDDARLHAYGTIDELNAILGMAIAFGLQPSLVAPLQRVQMELFTLGADLATPLDAKADWLVRLDASHALQLEAEIDQWDTELPALQNFILPSGTPAATLLHQARTVCRRAERWMVTLKEELNPESLIYVNRLSDWLFTLARVENARAGVAETIWAIR
jgi:cob(I)alamin adenosyltransferase